MTIQAKGRQVSRKPIVAPELVLNLPLWKRGGAASIMSDDRYGHLCTITGALWTPRGRLFDGDDIISFGDKDVFTLSTGLTVGGWFKFNSIATSPIVFAKASGASVGEYYLIWGADNTIAFRVVDNTNVARLGRLFAKTLDTSWLHIVATWNGGITEAGLAIYLNAVRSDTTDTSDGIFAAMRNTALPLELGRRGTGNYFNGTMGEVLAYNRAWTGLEVRRNYLATRWRYQ